MKVFWALSSPTIFFPPLLFPSYYSSVAHFYPILYSSSLIILSYPILSYPILSHAILLCYSPMLSNPILSELPLFLLISTLLYPIFITPLLYSIFSSPLLSSSLISSPIFISSLLSFSWPRYSWKHSLTSSMKQWWKWWPELPHINYDLAVWQDIGCLVRPLLLTVRTFR